MKQLLSLTLVMVAATAHADQLTAVSIGARQVPVAFEKLVEKRDEPVGLVALTNIPELALTKGDVVQTINGHAASLRPDWTLTTLPPAAVVYLDVLRGDKRITVRVNVKFDQEQQATIDRDDFDRMVERSSDIPESVFHPTTRDGVPSGVFATRAVDYLALESGDIIRTVDGAPVTTQVAMIAALDRARDKSQLVLAIERTSQPITLRLAIRGVSIAAITRLNDTTYEFPRTVVDMIRDNPTTLLKGARAVPFLSDGKPKGFMLWAIRPRSFFGALGLRNGDAVTAINQFELTDPSMVLEAFSNLRDAKAWKVNVIRRGKPITLEYRIK